MKLAKILLGNISLNNSLKYLCEVGKKNGETEYFVECFVNRFVNLNISLNITVQNLHEIDEIFALTN